MDVNYSYYTSAKGFKKVGGTASQFLKADGSADDTAYIPTSQRGVANGVASLDSNAKIPNNQINDRIYNKILFIGGEVADTTFTGLFDRNQLALADKEATVDVVLTGSGSLVSGFTEKLFNALDDFASITSANNTTELVVTIIFPTILPVYGYGYWQPFVKNRVQNAGYFKDIKVEVLDDNTSTWMNGTNSEITNGQHIEKSALFLFPLQFFGTTKIKGVRFTLKNAVVDGQYIYINQLGFRHLSHSMTPQLFHRGNDNKIFGTTTFFKSPIVPNATATNQAVNLGQINANFIPYTGATTNVNLNEKSITNAGSINATDLTASKSDGGNVNIGTNRLYGSNATPKYMNLNFLGYQDNLKAKICSYDAGLNTARSPLIFYTHSATGLQESMRIGGDGDIKILTLAGTGTRMVVADASGNLSSQIIPTFPNFTQTDVNNWNTAFGWENHATAGYATQTWTNTNFIPKTHPVYNVTATNISNWNEAFASSHTHSNLSFLNVINQELAITSDAIFESLRITKGVKALGNFLSENEEPDKIFIPDGTLADLSEEVTNDNGEIRVRPKEYNIDGSSHLSVDDKNRFIHIIGEVIKPVVELLAIHPKQEYTFYNFSPDDTDMDVVFGGTPIFAVPPNCSRKIYVTDNLRIILRDSQVCAFV